MTDPPHRSAALLVMPLLFAAAAAGWAGENDPAEAMVRAADDRLTVELFAEHPDIVTPTGIAVDRRGRVFVIESHTHQRPEGYDGPPADRIRILEDTDGDGRADRFTTFHEGLTHTMDLAFHRDGALYVATRGEILRLRDTDGDDKADEITRIVHLDTTGNYPHNGLSGLAFDFAGGLHFGLGENLGHDYTLRGSDGREIHGGGEGGSTYHCRADGAELRRTATGFWNPWGMCVDAFGRVFATDNDPDSAPPCRLIHVVEGGDYGYEFRYGRSGLHPLISWLGDMPGTLPMAAGTGEAPGGILAYESDALPDEYRGQLLVASWADHRIERYPIEQDGASVTARREVLVRGGDEFRPVDLAVGLDGSIYVSDWVSASYPVHGKGRVWRIRPKETATVDRPEDPGEALLSRDRRTREEAARALADSGQRGRRRLRDRMIESDDPRVRSAALQALAMVDDGEANFEAVAESDPSEAVRVLAVRELIERGADPAAFVADSHPPAVRAEALPHLDYDEHGPVILDHLSSDDPYLVHAAIEGLRDDAAAILADVPPLPEQASQRLGLLLALKRSGSEAARELLPAFLDDPAPAVRFAAVKWIADRKLIHFRPKLEEILASDELGLQLFLAATAAIDRLDGKPPKDRPAPNDLYRRIVSKDAPVNLRRLSLRLIDPHYEPLALDRLRPLLDHEDAGLRLEAVRTLQRHPDRERMGPLAGLAADPGQPIRIRAEAVLGLAPAAERHADLLMGLAGGNKPTLRDEALRALIGVPLSEDQRAALDRLADAQPETAEAVARLLADAPPQRPSPDDTDAWLALVEGEGDPAAGRRIFFHPKVGTCSSCHTVNGRGVKVGPDLTRIGRRADERYLLESILQPHREIAPQFTPWAIETTDGQTLLGLPLRKGSRAEAYLGPDGREFTVRKDKIESHRELDISLMPPGLAEQMTPRELSDLLAYLLQPR